MYIMVSSKVYTEKTVSGMSSIFFLLKDCTSLNRPINAKAKSNQKCFEIWKNIDNILDTVYSVTEFRYIPLTIPSLGLSENIAFNKIPIKLHLLSHYDTCYDKASLIWV